MPAGDAAAWETTLRAAVTDPEFRGAAQANAAAVRERFTWPAAAVQAWYLEVLTAPR